MGVVYLVRHGQANPAAYGVASREAGVGGLTEKGRAQSKSTGVWLAGRTGTVTAAVSGALARQRETLELILPALDVDTGPAGVRCDPGWDEYDMDAILGGGERAATGVGKDLQREIDAALIDWVAGAPVPGGETYGEYRDRCAAAFESVQADAGSGRTVVVASSAGTICQVLATQLDLDGAGWIRLSRTMINASITKLIVGGRGASVVSINEHGHLEGSPDLMTFR